VTLEHDLAILRWTEILTGLPPDWVVPARERVASWSFPKVSNELMQESVDGYVASTLLSTSMDALLDAGIDEARLLKKLRETPDVWPTWAEFRIAHNLLESHLRGATLNLEAGKSAGAHADFRFVLEGDGVSVEVKAVGMSDEEVAFCSRMAPSLQKLLPKSGLGHLHAPINAAPPHINREGRRFLDKEAARLTRKVPMWPKGLRGMSIVAHDSERSYAQRVGSKVAAAVRQLPEHDRCWAAIHWSNGAPIRDVREHIPWDEIPTHVEGIFLLGCGVAFPQPQIHCFAVPIPRGALPEEDVVVGSVDADQDDLAAIILERFEQSSGIRPTLLKVEERTLLFRDGRKRIWPFNLLMDRDSAELGRDAEAPVWRR
jgi:hypothetical protein